MTCLGLAKYGQLSNKYLYLSIFRPSSFSPYLYELESEIGVRNMTNLNQICLLTLSRYSKTQTRSKPEKPKWSLSYFDVFFQHVKSKE